MTVSGCLVAGGVNTITTRDESTIGTMRKGEEPRWMSRAPSGNDGGGDIRRGFGGFCCADFFGPQKRQAAVHSNASIFAISMQAFASLSLLDCASLVPRSRIAAAAAFKRLFDGFRGDVSGTSISEARELA